MYLGIWPLFFFFLPGQQVTDCKTPCCLCVCTCLSVELNVTVTGEAEKVHLLLNDFRFTISLFLWKRQAGFKVVYLRFCYLAYNTKDETHNYNSADMMIGRFDFYYVPLLKAQKSTSIAIMNMFLAKCSTRSPDQFMQTWVNIFVPLPQNNHWNWKSFFHFWVLIKLNHRLSAFPLMCYNSRSFVSFLLCFLHHPPSHQPNPLSPHPEISSILLLMHSLSLFFTCPNYLNLTSFT